MSADLALGFGVKNAGSLAGQPAGAVQDDGVRLLLRFDAEGRGQAFTFC